MASSETLRSVIDAGRGKRLDELSSARVIGKIALQINAAQQKAGAGKAVGPITPGHIKLSPGGDAKVEMTGGPALGYTAPEQLAGGAGDRRSDVFSLGAVLWEALTYQRLFDAMNDAAVKIAVQEREITPPAEHNANVPAELSAICMRALARNPSDRYQSLKAMAVEIEEFLEEAGYEDSDAKIAAHLAALAEPPQQVKIAMPPLTRPASSTQPPPDRAKRPSGVELAAALANAGKEVAGPATTQVDLPPAGKVAPTMLGVPKLDDWQDKPADAHAHPPVPAAAPLVAADAAAPESAAEKPPLVPMPPVLPASAAAAVRTDKATISVSVPPPVNAAAVDAKHVEAKQPALIVEDKPQALIVETEETAKPTLVDAKPPEVVLAPANAKPAAAETVPVEAVKRPPSQSDASSVPHPANAVALGPIPGGKDSKDLLAGWGWGTDKHDAIPPDGYRDDSDDDLPIGTDHRKTLTYVIGGGLGLAAIVTIIAFGFGGSNDKKKATAASAKTAPAQVEPAPAPQPVPAPPPQPAPDPAQLEADRLAAEQASAEAAKLEAEQAAAAQAEADRRAREEAVAAAKAEAEQAEAAKAEAARLAKQEAAAKAEAARVAKAEAAKIDAAKKAEAARVAREQTAARKAEAAKTTPKPTPVKTAKAEPRAVAKTDVESAYRQGLQLFARGDTSGALASLRTSLAGNPNYAPTWRGLGLVFEKMGEKDQARAAYKRYLQLAPGAGDADQIRGRLERLGS